MRVLADIKRSTAPSNGMDAKTAAKAPLSSPAAAQRCAEGAGLDSGALAAAQSAMPSIARLPPHPRQTTSTQAATPMAPQLPALNLHQLDGRDPQYVLVRVAVTKPEERLEPERGQLRQALTRRFRL